MKKAYTAPETEIIAFDTEDIIETSFIDNPELPAKGEP